MGAHIGLDYLMWWGHNLQPSLKTLKRQGKAGSSAPALNTSPKKQSNLKILGINFSNKIQYLDKLSSLYLKPHHDNHVSQNNFSLLVFELTWGLSIVFVSPALTLGDRQLKEKIIFIYNYLFLQANCIFVQLCFYFLCRSHYLKDQAFWLNFHYLWRCQSISQAQSF